MRLLNDLNACKKQTENSDQTKTNLGFVFVTVSLNSVRVI